MMHDIADPYFLIHPDAGPPIHGHAGEVKTGSITFLVKKF